MTFLHSFFSKLWIKLDFRFSHCTIDCDIHLFSISFFHMRLPIFRLLLYGCLALDEPLKYFFLDLNMCMHIVNNDDFYNDGGGDVGLS